MFFLIARPKKGQSNYHIFLNSNSTISFTYISIYIIYKHFYCNNQRRTETNTCLGRYLLLQYYSTLHRQSFRTHWSCILHREKEFVSVCMYVACINVAQTHNMAQGKRQACQSSKENKKLTAAIERTPHLWQGWRKAILNAVAMAKNAKRTKYQNIKRSKH